MSENKRYSANGKLVYLEFLRIIAIFGVLYSHMSQYVISNEEIYEKSKILYFTWSSMYTISKTAVLLFFMISGCLLLGKTESITVVLRKRVLRMAVVLISFTFIFYLALSNDDWSQFSFIGYLKLLFGKGVGTYWYLYAYIGWLLSLPFLRPVVQWGKNHISLFKYLIVLKIIWSVVIPIVENFSGVSANAYFDVVFVGDIIFYSALGFYYGKVHESKRKDCINWGIAAFVTLIIDWLLTIVLTQQKGILSLELSMTGIFSVTFAIFLGAKYFFEKMNISEKVEKMICWLGGCVFTIYLMENILGGKMMFIYYKAAEYVPSFIAFVIYLNVTILTGGFIATILKKIPILKDFI